MNGRQRETETMKLFEVGEVVNHRVGDAQCPECAEEYPEPCRCGGLMHASETAEEDSDGNIVVVTLCDQCGQNEDQLAEAHR
jgi:hypothetical protein